MFTARGWWFALSAITVLAMGGVLALQGATSLLLIGLSLCVWFAIECFVFSIQARLTYRQLELTRELRDDRGNVTTLWAGQSFSVRVALRLKGARSLGYVVLTDRAPAGAGPVEGSLRWSGSLSPDSQETIEYRVQCPTPGAIRFEGVRVQLADFQGFFYFETFLRVPAQYAVLPKLVDAEAHQRATKRFNLLPPPGIHRLRRPGSGSELLDLRDYRPGDPPKRIAWKASARRDKLITRELESEVPIRCTLFLDASDSVRLGPPGRNSLSALIDVTATVAQAAAGNRDLVGLAICDEDSVEYVAPARSSIHTIGLLRRLARTANLAPATEAAEVGPLIDRAYAVATEIYPDLLRPSVNRFPAWLPFISPQPFWTMRQPPLHQVLLRTVRLLALILIAVSIFLGFLGGAIVAYATFLAGCAIGLADFAMWLLWNYFSSNRRRYAWRKKLAAILAVKHGRPPGALALLLEDDAACARELQQFLAEHQIPYEVPLYDRRGRYLFARPAKIETIAKTLVRSVGRGHDNELFVILADLLELEEQLAPLLKAVRIARARHHSILVVCPWPAGLASPQSPPESSLPSPGTPAVEIVRQAARARMHRAWRAVRRAFGRIGVPVLDAGEGDPARLILHRLEQLRTVQGASRG